MVNGALAQGIAAALDTLDADPGLSVGVLAGAGNGFSAGMDLKAFVAGERPCAGDRGFAGITRRASDKPLIAAIEGFAVAGGLEVALAYDLIVAARGTRLDIPEVKRSLVAAGGALLPLRRRLPHRVAMELAFTGDPIDVERTYSLVSSTARGTGGSADHHARTGRGDRGQRPAGAYGDQADLARIGPLARYRILSPASPT